MKAMILAAGLGTRLQPLTKSRPKPLVELNKKPMIAHAIEKLISTGVDRIIINAHYKKSMLIEYIKRANFDADITVSVEDTLLDAGGAVVRALPMLGDEPFILMSSDIITDYPMQNLTKKMRGKGHMVFVENPDFKPNGDYGLQKGRVVESSAKSYTYASFGIYHPSFFEGAEDIVVPFNFFAQKAISEGNLFGEVYDGFWHNIGTQDQLKECEEALIERATID